MTNKCKQQLDILNLLQHHIIIKIIMLCPGTTGGSGWTCLSWYEVWVSLQSFSCARMWSFIRSQIFILIGRFPLNFCWYNISTAEGNLWLIGVVWRHNQAISLVTPTSLALISVCLTVCIDLSTRPLLCENLGLLVTFLKQHSLAKFLYAELLYWGPLSLTTFEGIPCSLKSFLLHWTTVSDFVFGSWCTNRNLL